MREAESDTARRRHFDALFEAHCSDIVAYCAWRASSPSDAQDAVAEVFLAAWRRLDELPAGDARRVWLYATARRVMANQRRSARRRAALHERLVLETGTVREPQPAASPEETCVREALSVLGPRDREVLLLAEWEGLTPAEIAGVMRCHTVTARGRLHRARRRFRAAFEELRERDVRAAAAERPTGLLTVATARADTTAHARRGGS